MADKTKEEILNAPRRQEEDHDVDDEEEEDKYTPGKQIALKEQLEMDKDDESLRRWKQQLLGNVDVAGTKPELQVTFTKLVIQVVGRGDVEIPIPTKGAQPANETPQRFSLKEGSKYRLKFEFLVKNEILVGLTYLNKVFRMGVQVDKSKVMLGVYGPQEEPYTYVTEEETAPSGMLARGTYKATAKFCDDDGKVHLEFPYTFEIEKDK